MYLCVSSPNIHIMSSCRYIYRYTCVSICLNHNPPLFFFHDHTVSHFAHSRKSPSSPFHYPECFLPPFTSFSSPPFFTSIIHTFVCIHFSNNFEGFAGYGIAGRYFKLPLLQMSRAHKGRVLRMKFNEEAEGRSKK